MKTEDLIDILERYNKIENLFNSIPNGGEISDLVKLLKNYPNVDIENLIEEKNYSKENKSKDRDIFMQMVQESKDGELNWEHYKISDSIKENANNIIEWWSSLTNIQRDKFRILELNIILYLISSEFKEYRNEKKKTLIIFITNIVRDKKMNKSYHNIVV